MAIRYFLILVGFPLTSFFVYVAEAEGKSPNETLIANILTGVITLPYPIKIAKNVPLDCRKEGMSDFYYFILMLLFFFFIYLCLFYIVDGGLQKKVDLAF